ncbi:MAG: glutamyl-tRNA reductase [Bdellovibrionota bacterium]
MFEEFERGEHPLIQVTGLNHRTAAVELREQLALQDGEQPKVLERLLAVPAVEEALVLSTCNRVEVVIAAKKEAACAELTDGLSRALSDCSGVAAGAFRQHLYHHRARSAVSHVFRVASGLDSLVVGEPQVLGQLKAAYEQASAAGTAKEVLHRLFHRAFRAAKVVRSKTGIGHNAVSVCYAAKELAEQIFGDLSQAHVMLVGAGEMGALALKHFAAAGVKQFSVVNKTLARACELAEVYGGLPLQLSQLARHLPNADIIIGTSSLPTGSDPLVSLEDVSRSVQSRSGLPQFYLDLSVPRNFPAGIDSLPDAFLYNIDDLERVVQENMSSRLLEAKRAEGIIDQQVEQFWQWLKRRRVDDSIRELAARYRSFEESEIQKTLRRLQRLGLPAESAELRIALEDLSQALLAKTLHQPVTSLRELVQSDPAALDLFRELFLGRKDD